MQFFKQPKKVKINPNALLRTNDFQNKTELPTPKKVTEYFWGRILALWSIFQADGVFFARTEKNDCESAFWYRHFSTKKCSVNFA